LKERLYKSVYTELSFHRFSLYIHHIRTHRSRLSSCTRRMESWRS